MVRYAKILDITRDAAYRHFEVTIGFYTEQPKLHRSEQADDREPDDTIILYLTDRQIRAIVPTKVTV